MSEDKLFPVTEAREHKFATVDKHLNAPAAVKARLSMVLKTTKSRNIHEQNYYVDLHGEIGKAKKERESIISKVERAFKKPISEFSPAEMKLLDIETGKVVINAMVADKLEYVMSGMSVAGSHKKGVPFERNIVVDEEGKGVKIYSPIGRRRGEKREANLFYDENKPVDLKNPDLTKRNEKGEVTINIYKHIDDEGHEHSETLFEHHKRLKEGGATNNEIKNQSLMLLHMAENIHAPKPDMIVTPPITAVDGKGRRLSKEVIQDKIDRSIVTRVAQYLSDNVQFASEKGTGKSLPLSSVISKTHKGEGVDVEKIKYDPMMLGTKDFQAKKMTGYNEGTPEHSVKFRSRNTLKLLREAFGFSDKDPEVAQMFMDDMKDKFKDVKHVWLVDDNVDTGGTLFAMSKILENIGVSSTAMTLFDMKITMKHPTRESAKEISKKAEQGKLQFKSRIK